MQILFAALLYRHNVVAASALHDLVTLTFDLVTLKAIQWRMGSE